MEHYQSIRTTTHFSDLARTAQQLINFASGCKLWLFTGDLGAGKTTLIQAICHELGVSAQVTSPTFSIVNTYPLQGGCIHHIDAYRLKNVEEALGMDFPFYFETGMCLLEWPSKIPQTLFPTPHIDISLVHDARNEDQRILTAQWIV